MVPFGCSDLSLPLPLFVTCAEAGAPVAPETLLLGIKSFRTAKAGAGAEGAAGAVLALGGAVGGSEDEGG